MCGEVMCLCVGLCLPAVQLSGRETVLLVYASIRNVTAHEHVHSLDGDVIGSSQAGHCQQASRQQQLAGHHVVWGRALQARLSVAWAKAAAAAAAAAAAGLRAGL
jgi:hypothetical protein